MYLFFYFRSSLNLTFNVVRISSSIVKTSGTYGNLLAVVTLK